MVILAALVATLIFLLVSPPSFSEIQKEIKIANFCGSDEDCAVIESKCPFSCDIAISANEVERIQDLIDGHKADCSETCSVPERTVCISNKCQVTKR